MADDKRKLTAVDIIAILPVVKAIIDQLAAGLKWLITQWDERKSRKETKKLREGLIVELTAVDKELETEVNEERRKELKEKRKSILSEFTSS